MAVIGPRVHRELSALWRYGGRSLGPTRVIGPVAVWGYRSLGPPRVIGPPRVVGPVAVWG